jgi:hypothetical protein
VLDARISGYISCLSSAFDVSGRELRGGNGSYGNRMLRSGWYDPRPLVVRIEIVERGRLFRGPVPVRVPVDADSGGIEWLGRFEALNRASAGRRKRAVFVRVGDVVGVGSAERRFCFTLPIPIRHRRRRRDRWTTAGVFLVRVRVGGEVR